MKTFQNKWAGQCTVELANFTVLQYLKNTEKILCNIWQQKNHTTVHYKPLHLHPVFKQKRKFPIADNEWKKFISFPCHAAMTIKDAEYVVYFVKNS